MDIDELKSWLSERITNMTAALESGINYEYKRAYLDALCAVECVIKEGERE